MKKLLKVLLLSISIFSFSWVLAIDAPTNITLESSTSDSITLSWDSVEWSLWYYLYYSINSENVDSSDSGEIYEENSANLLNLQPDTTYFVAIRSVDWSFEESELSEVMEFRTSPDSSSLVLEWVEVVSSSEFNMLFNNNLSEDNLELWASVRVTDKSNELKDFEVTVNSSNWKKLNITVEPELEVSNQYDFIAIEVYDENIEPITTWADASFILTTPDEFPWQTEEVIDSNEDPDMLNIEELFNTNTDESTWDEAVSELNQDELNSADASNNNDSNNNASASSVEQNTYDTAQNSEKLPQTWPTEWILLIISFLIWSFMFYLKSRTRV